MRVIEAEITKAMLGGFGGNAQVRVKLDGEEEFRDLFAFYSDELSFSPGDFIGLTLDEARGLKHKRDVEYLRS